MAAELQFSLVSPTELIFSGNVEHVVAPGVEGEFGILPGHAPFMSSLKNGIVRILSGNSTSRRIYVRGGFADVTSEGLTILAENAVDLDDTDRATLQSKIDAASAKLSAARAARNLENSEPSGIELGLMNMIADFEAAIAATAS